MAGRERPAAYLADIGSCALRDKGGEGLAVVGDATCDARRLAAQLPCQRLEQGTLA